MKKILLIILASTITLITTGCVKFEYTMDINKNDRINFSQTQGFNVQFFRAINPEFDKMFKKIVATLAEKYKKQGFQANEYNDEAFAGLNISKNNLTFKQTREILPAGFKVDDNSFIINKGFVKSSYKLHFYYDIREALSSPEIAVAQREISSGTPNVILSRDMEVRRINGQWVNMTAIKDEYDAIEGEKPSIVPISKLNIKIPAKAKNNNADKVLSDTEYQWNLAKEAQPVEIYLEYDVFDFSKLMITLSLILLLSAVFYLVNKLQKSDVVKGL